MAQAEKGMQSFEWAIEDSEMQVVTRGMCVDYWLPKRRLIVEISGTERTDQLASRLRAKRRQVTTNPLSLDGYVFLCCFAPSQRTINWSYHSIQEETVMRGKSGTRSKLLEDMLRESSWQVSHALALSEEGRAEEANAAWLTAADREERVACLLEAEGHEAETAVHYVSAASCLARVADYVHAVALLRCALSFDLRPAYQREVEKLLQGWLPKAGRQLRRQESRQPARVP